MYVHEIEFEFGVLVGKPKNPRPSELGVELTNKLSPHTLFDVRPRIRTQATLVEGNCFHLCQDIKKSKLSICWNFESLVIIFFSVHISLFSSLLVFFCKIHVIKLVYSKLPAITMKTRYISPGHWAFNVYQFWVKVSTLCYSTFTTC